MFRNKKNVVTYCIIMLLMLSFSLVGCNKSKDLVQTSNSDSQKSFEIGVVSRDFNSPFQVSIKKAMEDAIKEYPNCKLDIRDGENDVSVQTNIIETFVAQEKDLIIVVPAQVDALGPAVKKANEADIPVITVNNQLGEGGEVLTYVGVDEYQGGRLQGELVNKMLGGKGNIVLLQGVLGSYAQIARQKGLEDYLNENAPDIKIVAAQNNDWDNAKTVTVMQNFLTRFSAGEIDGVVVQGPFDAISAADTIQSAGRTELVGKVIAYDMPQDVIDAIKNGTLYGTINQDPAVQGSLVVQIACDYLNGVIKKENIKAETWADLPKVDKSNVDEFTASW
jgi:ribose transport system substrate-binding protein